MIVDVRFVAGLVVLAVIAIGVLGWAGVGHRRAVVLAILRAAAQLAVVAAALRGALSHGWAVALVVAVMFGIAVVTARGRLASFDRPLAAVVLSCALGATVAIGLIVGLPVLDRDLRNLIAVSGIVIGGTMTAVTLTGRRLHDGIQRRRDEIEAWLALGATPRVAVRDVARSAVYEALVPALDQTRTVGLVTLPGAFVGALLGGASPVQAARFQLAVLVGLLCAEAIAATCLAYRLGAPATLPEVGVFMRDSDR